MKKIVKTYGGQVTSDPQAADSEVWTGQLIGPREGEVCFTNCEWLLTQTKPEIRDDIY